MDNDQYFALIVLTILSVLGVCLAVVLGPVGRALSRRIDGKSVRDPGQVAMLEDLASRVEDGAELRRELAELQERVDFAERVLAQGRDTAQLSGGKD